MDFKTEYPLMGETDLANSEDVLSLTYGPYCVLCEQYHESCIDDDEADVLFDLEDEEEYEDDWEEEYE